MKYQRLEPLAEGASAELFRAFDPTLERFVVLKFLRRSDAATITRFQREARAQARIQHDHVCQIYDVGELDGRPFIAMQYLDGTELGAAAASLGPGDKLRVMRQVAEGVEAAHRRGLVHRDLKPANIMVERDAEGRAKATVVDFGLVHELDRHDLTRTGELLGTAAYLAPEQARGDWRQVNALTDVWGLGAVLYELFVGRPPFVGESFLEVALKVLAEEPQPPREVAPTVPPEVEAVILRCLEKRPTDRYPSAGALAAELARLERGEAPITRPLSPLGRGRRWLSRHRESAWLVGLTLAFLVAAGGLALFFSWRGERDMRLIQTLGEEGKDLEWRMRAVHTSPLHDISPAKRQLAARVAALEARLPGLPEGVRPAGQAALGQGLLWQERPEQARTELEAAWESGLRSPDIAYALGLAYTQLYERELRRIRQELAPAKRAAATQQAEEELRARARTYLEVGKGADRRATDYVEALLLQLDRRHDEALARLRPAIERLPWLYEGHILAADILREQAQELRAAGKVEEGARLFQQSLAEAERATAVAPSSPRAHEQACVASVFLFETEAFAQEGAFEAASARVERACRRALEVDPERAPPYLGLAYVTHARAMSSIDEPASLERARAAQALAGEAAARDPQDLRAAIMQGQAALLELYFCVGLRRCDPAPALGRALASFERVLARQPFSSAALLGKGDALAYRAEVAEARGQDARAQIEEAIAFSTRAVEVDPQDESARAALAIQLLALAASDLRHGGPVEPHVERVLALLSQLPPGSVNAPTQLQAVAMAHLARAAATSRRDAHVRGELAAARAAIEQALALSEGQPSLWGGRAEIAAFEARAAALAGSTFEPALAVARSHFRRALAGEGAFHVEARLADLELAVAEWTYLRGAPIAAQLVAVRRLLDELAAGAEPFERLSWEARYQALRALGGPREERGQALDAGFAAVEQALHLGPGSAQNLASRGLLLLARAELEGTDRAAARAVLEEAARANRWQAPDLEPWLRRAR